MKKLNTILFVAALIFTHSLIAQQLPQVTQYLLNDFAVNPAIGGTKTYFDARSNHRYQWVGINDAPRTYTFSIHGPIQTQKMGAGAFLYTDITGPTRRIGFKGSYSYMIHLSGNIIASFGLSAGVQQFAVDGAKIISNESGDIAMSSGFQSALVPDFGAGTYIFSDNWYVSLSAPQILNSKLQFFENYENTLSRLANHYYLMGGYNYELNDDITLEPSLMVKYVYPVNPQFQATVKAAYQGQVWVAASYRSEDAVSASVGYRFKDNVMVGYSYDFTTSNIKNYSSGTHEFMLGVWFRKSTLGPQPGQPIIPIPTGPDAESDSDSEEEE